MTIAELIKWVKDRRARARQERETLFIYNRDDGCIFCKRLYKDDPMHRYLKSPDERRFILTYKKTGQKFAICEWHREILKHWGSPAKRAEMIEFIDAYLKHAQRPF